MRAYLDSCVFMYLVEHAPVFWTAIRERLFGQRPRICWTALTRLECRVKPLRNQDVALLEKYEAFFALPDNIYLGLEWSSFQLATELRARHGLKTPDALHLAAAIEGGCDEFWTNDHRLDNAASRHLKTVTF
jgi:predicted nucleic acid-binding protein